MTERGDGKEDKETGERVGDKQGKTLRNERRELDTAGEIEKKRHRHIHRGGEKRGRRGESENNRELLIVASAPATLKEKAADKIKCHHLGRDWRVP